jgi:hypothetical protein
VKKANALFLQPLSSLEIGTPFRSNYQPEQSSGVHAEVAHLVERDLAKVEVAGSSPVFRSESPLAPVGGGFFLLLRFARNDGQKRINISPGGGIGRHAGLKIL